MRREQWLQARSEQQEADAAELEQWAGGGAERDAEEESW